eukprot:5402851-Prorocentrum_lima.AAC.1
MRPGGEETDAAADKGDDEAEEINIGKKQKKLNVRVTALAHGLESMESGLEASLHLQSKQSN